MSLLAGGSSASASSVEARPSSSASYSMQRRGQTYSYGEKKFAGTNLIYIRRR